jgi:nicotinamidase-related amidase
MDADTLIKNSQPFLRYLVSWEAALPALSMAEVAKAPEKVAVLCVDVLNGFCYEGALASPRMKATIAPVVQLFKNAYAAGVRHFLLSQDTHDPDAVEFGQWPPHCVRGTAEAEAVPELKALPFYPEITVMPKNSIQSFLGTPLEGWLHSRPDVSTLIVAGDATDLCTYQLAMHLRLRANAAGRRDRIILAADCVDTFDIPVEIAAQIGAMPHDGDLLHAVFLHHMALNGVEVAKSIQ